MNKVYICSPYRGDVERNTQGAQRYCRFAVHEGCLPIAPHLLFPQFLDEDNEKDREKGLDMGLRLLKDCAEIWVFGDEATEGMQQEILLAKYCHERKARFFDTDCNELVSLGGAQKEAWKWLK